MKRAMYAIPLATLGLSFSGCADPIVATFNATTFDDNPFPYDGAGYEVSFSMTVAEDLTASFAYSINYEDPAATDYTATSSGAVSIVEKGAKYDISLNLNGRVIALACDMNADLDLSCVDDAGAVFAFSVAE